MGPAGSADRERRAGFSAVDASDDVDGVGGQRPSRAGRGVVEPATIVCDFSTVGPESVVRAGACVKQRDTHPPRSVLDGFPARAVDSLAEAPGRPGWALPPDAVGVIRRIDR